MGIERVKMWKRLVRMIRPGLGFKSSPQTDFGKEVLNSQESFQLHSLFFFTLLAPMLTTLEN